MRERKRARERERDGEREQQRDREGKRGRRRERERERERAVTGRLGRRTDIEHCYTMIHIICNGTCNISHIYGDMGIHVIQVGDTRTHTHTHTHILVKL